MTILGVRPRPWAVGSTALLAFGAFGVMSGCSDDAATPQTPTTYTFQGGYSDSGSGVGVLDFTIAAVSARAVERVTGGTAVSATGEVRPSGGSPVAMTGFYDPTTLTITLSQGTRRIDTFSLEGVFQSGAFHGTITTPSGSGGFAAISVSTVAPATIYCGEYDCGTCGGGGGGSFDSIVFGSSVIVGIRSFADGITVPLAGTRSGSSIAVDDQGVVAAGTIAGTSVSGTYSVSANLESGTWTGTTGSCALGRRL